MNPRTVAQFLRNAVRQFSLPDGESSRSSVAMGLGIDTVYLVDISDSMKATDYHPSRLGAAQSGALELLRRRIATGIEGRVGVGAYNQMGFPVCPLTALNLSSVVEAAINSLEARGGTAMATGLEVAEHLFTQAQGAAMRREIVMLSDGHNQSGADPREVADRLKASGCKIRTIGIGGNEKAVDAELLTAIASLDADGRPMYSFIANRDGLLRHLSEIGGLTR